MNTSEYSIKIATHDFKCPLCSTRVRVGDAHLVDIGGLGYCFCVLPERRLVKRISISKT